MGEGCRIFCVIGRRCKGVRKRVLRFVIWIEWREMGVVFGYARLWVELGEYGFWF